MSAEPLRVALLGCGVVGSQVARLMVDHADELEQRVGARLDLVGALVRDASVPREGIDQALLTTDAHELLVDRRPDIVIELIGGIEPARELILTAMRAGASVVTANKALLALDGASLHDAAAEHGVDLAFEASVAGAIPLLRPLKESLAGDSVRRVLGIVNGTTNYILTRMDESGAAYDDALAEAQALGYAEADPTADVEGLDAAAKAAILAGLAFHTPCDVERRAGPGHQSGHRRRRRCCARHGARHQAARRRRALRRRRHRRAGEPGDGAAHASAGQRP